MRAPFAPRSFRRYLPVAIFAAILLAFAFVTRVALLLRPDTAIDLSAATLAQIFGVGLFFDLAAAAYFCAPLVLYLALLPERVARWRPHAWVFLAFYVAFTYLLVVVAVAEWVFWDEFAARFNFIAVDYLVYTGEVLGNIWQSYPVGRLLALLVVPAVLLCWPLRRTLADALAHPAPLAPRLGVGAALLLLPVFAMLLVNTRMKELSKVDAVNELAGNGIYEFFAANYNNELSYARFYAMLPPEQAMRTARSLVGGAQPRWLGATPVGMHRELADPDPPKRFNVVLVSIESLGSEFLGAFGNPEGLTPRLDTLARESLSFTQLYATGNRTVRGMEALALSLPPTPGQSIVKRPNNENLFTLGSVFRDHGYDVAYLYGGYGYFDNLNYFFGNSGYRVIDRTAIDSRDIHHETIWGVADEDLFALALREMDRSKLTGGSSRPFFMHVMTTSNHRPYTYPAGRIDIASGSGRSGAVKYTDWAVGWFLDEAKKHAWFKDTIFVITADHGASARGTTHIPVLKYRIPLFVYSPAHILPGRYERLMSQIDIGPTMLGLLDMGYASKFFGRDVFTIAPGEDRALVGNYQTLGYMKDGRLVTLQPQRKVSVTPLAPDLGLPPPTGVPVERLRDEAISLYQAAALIYDSGLQKHEAPGSAPTRAAFSASRTQAR